MHSCSLARPPALSSHFEQYYLRKVTVFFDDAQKAAAFAHATYRSQHALLLENIHLSVRTPMSHADDDKFVGLRLLNLAGGWKFRVQDLQDMDLDEMTRGYDELGCQPLWLLNARNGKKIVASVIQAGNFCDYEGCGGNTCGDEACGDEARGYRATRDFVSQVYFRRLTGEDMEWTTYAEMRSMVKYAIFAKRFPMSLKLDTMLEKKAAEALRKALGYKVSDAGAADSGKDCDDGGLYGAVTDV